MSDWLLPSILSTGSEINRNLNTKLTRWEEGEGRHEEADENLTHNIVSLDAGNNENDSRNNNKRAVTNGSGVD